MNASVREVMITAGQALNDTFHLNNVAKVTNTSGSCATGIIALLDGIDGREFDYIVTMEDLSFGQRIANYSVEFQAQGSSTWEILVPAALANGTKPSFGFVVWLMFNKTHLVSMKNLE